ncbi:MAG: hypothetical protein Q9167_005761 [Letrouitia subvulpina]
MSARLTALLGSRTELFEFIDPESEELSELNDTFLRSYPHLGMFCFFEAQPPKNSFGLTQPLVVEKSAAIIPGRPHGVLNLNHMELNKFASEEDQNYQKVCDVIRLLANDEAVSRTTDTAAIQHQKRGNYNHTHILSESVDRRSVVLEQYMSLSSSRMVNPVQEESEAAIQAKLYLDQLRREDDFLDILQPKSSNSREIEISSRHEGTCNWILEHSLFKVWDNTENLDRKFLSIVAPPGWGKSVLAKFLFQIQSARKPPSDDSFVLAFFCKNTEGQNTAAAIVKSFLHALLSRRREFFQHVLPYMRKNSSENTLSFRNLWAMFVAILNDPRLAEVRMIIDDLDECVPDSQNELLRAIEKSMKEDSDKTFRGRILVTSHPTPIAVEVGTRLGILHVSLDDVAGDISKLIHAEVDKLAIGRGYPDELTQSIKEKLENEADGMFLWVGFVLEELNRDDHPDTRNAIDQILATLPHSLGEFYARNLDNIPKNFRADARQIFQILLASPQPQVPNDLAIHFTKWPEDCSSLEELTPHIPLNIGRYAKAACGSFIMATDTSVDFVHQSARDYLQVQNTEASTAAEFMLDPKSGHLAMLKTCLRFLLLDDVQIWSIEPLPPNFDISSTKYAFTLYAVAFWGFHARNASHLDEESQRLLKKFLVEENTYLNEWIDRTYRLNFEDSSIDHGHNRFRSLLGALILQDLLVVVKQTNIIRDLELDLNQVDCAGFTPLIVAAGFGRLELIEFLKDAGAELTLEAREGGGALHYAPGDSAALLIDAGMDINIRDKYGNCPLHYAVMSGSEHTVELLLRRNAEVDAKSNSGNTPLFHAVWKKHVAIAKQLLTSGADMRVINKDGDTVMFAAAMSDNIECIDFLRSQGAGIDDQRYDGQTAIFSAIGYLSTLKYLLELGADVNHRRKDGMTVLHCAAAIGSEPSLPILLDHGADVAALNAEGRSVLHSACISGNVNVANFLAERVPDINIEAQNKGTALFSAVVSRDAGITGAMIQKGLDVRHHDDLGLTPLHLAALDGQDEIVTLLVKAGADVNAKDNIGETPLLCALAQKKSATANLLLSYDVDPTLSCNGVQPLHVATSNSDLTTVSAIIRKGVDIDARLTSHHNGVASLHLAANEAQPDIILELLDTGADANLIDDNGLTALHYAAFTGDSQTVKVLINNYSNVNMSSHLNRTCLHIAAMVGQVSVVQILLDAGADPNLRDHKGETAMDIARAEGHFDVVELLSQRGATPSDAQSLDSEPDRLATERSRHRARLQMAVNKAMAAEIPTDLDQREKYFMEEIGKGEKLMVNGMSHSAPFRFFLLRR